MPSLAAAAASAQRQGAAREVDLSSAFYALNPSGDLGATQRAFQDWFAELRWEVSGGAARRGCRARAGAQLSGCAVERAAPLAWGVKLSKLASSAPPRSARLASGRALCRGPGPRCPGPHCRRTHFSLAPSARSPLPAPPPQGKAGEPPSAAELSEALQRAALFVYLGHGGGEQYLPAGRLRALDRCSASLLMGCSSGRLALRRHYEPGGVVLAYLLAGEHSERVGRQPPGRGVGRLC